MHKLLSFVPSFLVDPILFIRKHWRQLVFRCKFNVALGYYAIKYHDDTAEAKHTFCQWFEKYVHKEEESFCSDITKAAWSTCKTISELEREIS